MKVIKINVFNYTLQKFFVQNRVKEETNNNFEYGGLFEGTHITVLGKIYVYQPVFKNYPKFLFNLLVISIWSFPVP